PLLEYRRRLAIARQDEEIAQVDMHRVDPAARRLEDPDLRFPHPRPGVDAVLVEELSIDLPRSIGAVELEPALDPDPGEQLGRALRHGKERVGHPARVVDGTTLHHEFEQRRAGIYELVRLATVRLLQAVHQEHFVGSEREVDDDLDAFRPGEPEVLNLTRTVEEKTVRADGDEGLVVAQEELVDAGARAIQDPEPVLAPLYLEERLDLAVHQELVAEEPVVVEVVVDEKAVLVE